MTMDATHATPPAGLGDDRGDIVRYARISDMAREFGITMRALRFYENKGLLRPRREGTTRLYGPGDKVRLRLVLLGRKIGFTLREVKQIMDLYDPKGANTRQLRTFLEKSQRHLIRLQKQREATEEAISELKRLMAEADSRLRAG